jgi:hypothetical protein
VTRSNWPVPVCCHSCPPMMTTGRCPCITWPPDVKDPSTAATAQRSARPEGPGVLRARGAPVISASATADECAAMSPATCSSWRWADGTAECAVDAAASMSAAVRVVRKLRRQRPSAFFLRRSMASSTPAHAARLPHTSRRMPGVSHGPATVAAHTSSAAGARRRSVRRRFGSVAATSCPSGNRRPRMSARIFRLRALAAPGRDGGCDGKESAVAESPEKFSPCVESSLGKSTAAWT